MSRLPEATFCLVVVGIGAMDGLAQPSIGRKPAKSRGKGKKCKRKGHYSPYKGGQSPNLGTLESCQKHRPRAREFAHQCPRGVWQKLAQLVVDHITLLGFVLVIACCVAKLGVVHQNAPTRIRRLHFHVANGALGTSIRSGAVFDSMYYCAGSLATVEEVEEDQEMNDIEDFFASSIKNLETFAFLDEGATKTVS